MSTKTESVERAGAGVKRWKVTVKEICQTVVYVDAETEFDARLEAHKRYKTNYASRDYVWYDTRLEAVE